MEKVTINQGTLKGKKLKTANGYEYIGFIQIPYAKPPLGNLRFKSPQPPDKWEGERDASNANENLISLQYNPQIQLVAGSEDCLYLNVYVPILPKNEAQLLPVIVYIHGGCFLFGNGTLNKDCNPEFLIDKEVIIVTINYRLGIFGFLCLDIPDAAGNMGLKDQIMALKWVQQNIINFGGDKNNVTLMGISAGAASIEYILLSQSSAGLYHKAIIQSGSSLNHWASNFDIKNLSVKISFDMGYEGQENSYQSIYDFLMRQTTEKFVTVMKNTYLKSRGLNFSFVPTVEKDFGNNDAVLTRCPYKILKEGKFNKVPVIRGYCEYEGLLMTAMKPKDVEELVEKKNYFDYWKLSINAKDIDKYSKKFEEIYSEGKKKDANELAIEYFGDIDFICDIVMSNKMTVAQGVTAFGYVFAYDGDSNCIKKMFGINTKGACHGDDTSYIINVDIPNKPQPSETDILIRNRMTEMWTDFAKTSNPTPTTSALIPVIWPAIDKNKFNYLIIDNKLDVKAVYNLKKLAIFEDIYEQYYK